MQLTTVSTKYETDTRAYGGLGSEEARPLGELLDVRRSPILTLVYWMPKPLCVTIATGTNRYNLQEVNQRAERYLHVYVGKRRSTDDSGNEVDYKTGAAAVVRNLKVALTAERRHPWHVVVMDRYYSSVLLAVELLSMNTYVVGTIATNRLGFD
ncbi:unnamed protein product [Phytophthora fragariaefolia]|uniref:Unnamed protein product n=1 Tax=Phytophthora fragariaefolia TaxID=1490495 RepID=A0A9W6Y7B6_9STRA|nr:unnamed protein product [Phytophthora fragariaefolia]